MRLWHEDIIPVLPRLQILGLHRECCAMRGNGWGTSHSVVNYVWKYPLEALVEYHFKVIKEMKRRKYKPDPIWSFPRYRGKNHLPYPDWVTTIPAPKYSEHNDAYKRECLELLLKRIERDMELVPGKYTVEEHKKVADALAFDKLIEESMNIDL